MAKQEPIQITASLAQFGFPLAKAPKTDPNELLKTIAQSDDPRLLEGFPVVLAHALNQDPSKLALDRTEASLKGSPGRERFQRLVGLSLALFDLYSLLPGGRRLKVSLATSETAEIGLNLARNQPVSLGEDIELDSPSLKNTFLQRVVHARTPVSSESGDRKGFKEDSRKEYHLSLLMSPRQKDLLYKKVYGESMTKTEREYFSRVVKKKLQALVDPDLNRLALKALS